MNEMDIRTGMKLEEHLRSDFRRIAEEEHVDFNSAYPLFNRTIGVVAKEVHVKALVVEFQNHDYSIKMHNIVFRLHEMLAAVIDDGLTITSMYTGDSMNDPLVTLLFMMKVLVKFLALSTVEISEKEASVLWECYDAGAQFHGVDTEYILQKANATKGTIDKLCELQCIKLENGKIRLLETIGLPNPGTSSDDDEL